MITLSLGTAFAIALASLLSPPAGLTVEDIFGRSLNEHGLVLVDWEGYIANPAIKVILVPPTDARYPVRVVVSAREPRLYFDMPSEARPDGPRKVIALLGPEKSSFSVSNLPDSYAQDEDYALDIEFTDADGVRRPLALPVHVVDQDRDRRSDFRVTVDFSQDKTGFFGDAEKRAVATQAAEDWAYFFDGTGLDQTPSGAETTLIWDPDGFNTSHQTNNGRAYTGYLLYAYGIDSPMLRSGGEPSHFGGFQSEGGKALPVRRSGGYEAEVKGNYNRRGYLVGLADAELWRATNLGDVENDLYSIAHHEIGHALVFNPANVRFGEAKLAGKLRDDRVRAYLGGDPKIDRADHLDGSIDQASLRGMFGNEFHGKTPFGRWLITRTDLLCAQAVGYKLRETSAFSHLTIRTEARPEGTASAPYSATLRAEGGIPSYDWARGRGGLYTEGLSLGPVQGLNSTGRRSDPGTSSSWRTGP